MNSRIVILLLALFSVAYVHAGEPEGIPWEALTQQERQVLKPFAGQWDDFTPQRQQRLRKGARRWQEMDAGQRQRIKKRFKRWMELSPESRARIRERYLRFLSLPPGQRQQLRERYQRFQNLPPERRREIRRRWEKMTPAEQQHLLDRRLRRHEPHAGRPHHDRPLLPPDRQPGQARPHPGPRPPHMPRDLPGR